MSNDFNRIKKVGQFFFYVSGQVYNKFFRPDRTKKIKWSHRPYTKILTKQIKYEAFSTNMTFVKIRINVLHQMMIVCQHKYINTSCPTCKSVSVCYIVLQACKMYFSRLGSGRYQSFFFLHGLFCLELDLILPRIF